jgi:hypothetical protein
MYPDSLVMGIVGASVPSCDAERERTLRDLTISWSRYDYRGEILEGATIDDVLEQASELGYAWCLVQAAGHVVVEAWHPTGGQTRFEECISEWLARADFLVLGAVIGDEAGGYGLDDRCLLVDVDRYAALGRPLFETTGILPGGNLIEVSLANGLSVPDLGPTLDGRTVWLGGDRVAPYLGAGIRSYRPAEAGHEPAVAAFLKEVQQQVVNSTRGIFLWNLEPYDDVRTPPRGFEAPISTLYSVASGFKPNVILDSHGFDERTRIVFFDYSANALEARRLLVDEWDGSDFPAFARYLFERLPHPAAFYQLWSGATPDTVDPRLLDDAWERELGRWGGEASFAQHWRRYRELRHQFVHCDVLNGGRPLVESVEREPDAVIWWSNAFFSVSGNWLYGLDERRRRYEDWIDALAERNPDLFLYGSDFWCNSVNNVQAADYRDLLRAACRDGLSPVKANAGEIRY